MLSQYFELRTLTFIDSLQPQLAQFIAQKNSVYDPSEYDSALVMEISPAMEIHRMVDLALKGTSVRLGEIITERHFGLFVVHHPTHGEVQEAGRAVLRETGLDENDRAPIQLLTNQIIRGVEKDHSMFFSSLASGNMVLSGESLLILEAKPASYMSLICNEALKAAEVKLIHIKPYGATGRLILSGKESEIDSCAEAALQAIEHLNHMQATKTGSQLG